MKLSISASNHLPRGDVLNDDQVIIDGVRFLGSILWTDFAQADKFFAMQQARQQMTDFSIIQNNGRCFTHEDAIRLNTAIRDWLAAGLTEPFDGKTVVVTHHALSSRSVHLRYANDLLTPAFASNLEGLMDGNEAALWVHGYIVYLHRSLIQQGRVFAFCSDPAYAENSCFISNACGGLGGTFFNANGG